MLSPSGLRGLRAAIHRTLTSPPFSRDINIMSDRQFSQTNKMFEAICKQYVQKANPKPKHHPAIAKGDLGRLALYLNQYKSSPEILLHCFWFLLCYNFARRGGEGWRALTRKSFAVSTDDQGCKYLSMTHTEKNKNWQGGSSSKAWDYSDTRAYGINIEGVNLNIVEVFQYYLARLHPDCPALFQKPKYKKWRKADNAVWFDNVPLGVNKINELMRRISDCANLSAAYTNHSVRATAITVMYQGGVDTKQICKITKHKSEESLKHYIDGQSADQKRRCSKVLSSAFQANSSCVSSGVPSDTAEEPSSLSLPRINVSTPARSVNAPSDPCVVATSAISTQVYNSSQSFAFPFHGQQSFNFSVTGGTCHFHFHYDSSSLPPVSQNAL